MVIAGAVSLVLAYLVFLSLIAVGIHYLIASIGNFLTYLGVNFFLNKTWAFRSKGNCKREALAHTSLHLGNQILIMVGLYILVEQLSVPAEWSQIIMQALVTLTVFILTPIIFKNR